MISLLKYKDFQAVVTKYYQISKDTLITLFIMNILVEMKPFQGHNGTVPKPNRFHDDPRLYTGVHKAGGPTGTRIIHDCLHHRLFIL